MLELTLAPSFLSLCSPAVLFLFVTSHDIYTLSHSNLFHAKRMTLLFLFLVAVLMPVWERVQGSARIKSKCHC
ncbi:hypothetical protein BKA57DRAFT_468444 [Linnemannia elongata]|nr:hypothetical protein BKA57DRAFT_468444 [Linnemannia elongata]